MQKIKELLQSDYVKNILRLFGGTSLSQVIPILISPVLTRLFSADHFGFFATYVSIYTVLSVFSTARYDQAVILTSDKNSLSSVVKLSFVLLIISTVVYELVVLVFNEAIQQYFELKELNNLIYLLPISVFFVGTIQITNYVLIKEASFSKLSLVKVLQAISVSLASLALGYFSVATGLVIGQLIGMITVSVLLLFWLSQFNLELFKIDIDELKKVANQYINFPKYDISASFLSVGTPQSIVLLLGAFFTNQVVGLYALTNRVLLSPIHFVSKSIVDVFREKATRDYQETGSCRSIYIKTFWILLSISVLPFSILFFFGDLLFGWVFGSEWVVSGQIAMILTPMYLLKFISSPLSYVLYIAEKQKINFYYQLVLFISIVGVLVFGQYLDDYMLVFKLISLIYSIFYIVFLFQSYRFSIARNSERG